jgi:hypothetical protein
LENIAKVDVEHVNRLSGHALIRFRTPEQASGALKNLQEKLKAEKITVRLNSSGNGGLILVAILVLAVIVYYFGLRNLLFKR